MLSDEEKTAVEKFKNFVYTYQEVIEDKYSDYEEKESAKEYQEVSEKILNLIEKQSKEIENLKEDNKKKSIVIIEYQDLYEKLEDKIKAKIEYYKKIDNAVGVRILESLLKKE